MADLEPLVLDIIARTDKLERSVKSAQAQFSTEADKMQRASRALAQRITSDSAASASALKGLAGSIGAYFSGRELAGIIDSFTQFENKLRVAGVAGEDLAGVQDRLFVSAQKYGVEIGALGGLFGSLATASKELGVTQEQVFQLTNSVSAALKVSGGSAQDASGALQQLGQALRGGSVQAEEYNSLLDGLFPLLEAAAAGSDRFGGSVGTLTKLVKDGKVSSREFFDAIVAGSDMLESRAAQATLTLSGAYTTLTNALTVYVGQAANTSGAQAALVQGIQTVADNIDTIIPAIALLGTALGVRYVASAGAAALSTLKADAALLGLSTRAEVAGYAIGSLVRSLAINTVVLSLTAAIGSFAAETATTSSLVAQANTQYDEMRKRLEAAGKAGPVAGDGARSVGEGAAAAETKVRSFAGAVGELAQKLYEQARAAKTARLEMLEKRLADSQAAEVDLGKRTPAGRNASAGELRRGDILNNLGVISRNATGSIRSLLSGGRTDREAAEAYRKQSQVSSDLIEQIRRAKETPLTAFVPTPASSPVATATGGKKTGGSSSSRSADQQREEQQRIQQEIANAQIAYLQELSQTTQNAADRAALEQKAIEATRLANEQDIKNNEALNGAQRDKLLEINNQVAGLRTQQIQDQEAERLRQQQLTLTSRALSDQDALLRLQSDLADTAKERREIELRRLDIAYRLEELSLAEELKQAEIANDTDRIAAARKRLADMEERRSADRKGVERSTESPMQRYIREANRSPEQFGEDLENIGVRGLEAFNDGLTEAIMGAKSLGDVFSNVAEQVIADLIRMAVQQLIVKTLFKDIAGASGGVGAGGGGGLGSMIGGLIGGIFGFSSGGYTGDGPRNKVAGVVHAGEYVVNAAAVKRIGLGNLKAMADGRAASIAGLVHAPAFSPARPPQQTIVVHVESSPYFDARVDQRAGNIAAHTSTVAGVQARGAAGADAARAARRRIPGR